MPAQESKPVRAQPGQVLLVRLWEPVGKQPARAQGLREQPQSEQVPEALESDQAEAPQ